MGLTSSEAGLFCLGSWLIVRFLFRIVLPLASRRFASASNRHSEILGEDFVRLSPACIATTLLLSGALLGCVVLAISESLTAGIASGAMPVLLAGSFIRRYRSRRKKAILSQLPVLLDLMAGHMRGGHSFPESLSETIPLLPDGIREEMSWVLQQNRLGTSLVESLSLWEKRFPSEDISLLVRPLRAAIPGGGNVVDLLEQTRDILRRRIRTKEKLRSMTAQARLQAVVLTLLPPSFAAALSMIDPSFFPNLVGTPQGKSILLIAGSLQTMGWITIRRILAVRP